MTDHTESKDALKKWLTIGCFALAWFCLGAGIALGTKNPDDVVRNVLWYVGVSSLIGGVVAAAAFYG